MLSFRIASDAKILLQNLDAMATELSGKVFSDLNAAQQSALNNLLVLSQQTTGGINQNIKQLDEAIRSAGEGLSRLPGVSDRPFVSTYYPSYLLQQSGNFDFSVQGSLLNSDKQHLTIGQAECKILSSVEKSVRFSCPAEALGTGQDWVTGLLTLTQTKRWYQFWKDDDVYQYNVAIRAIAAEMGTYTLDVTTRHKVEDRISRSGKNEHRNDHCQGGRDVVWNYSPAQSCTVDVNSVTVKHGRSRNSTFHGITNLTSHGFQIRGIVRNNGSCGPWGVPKDGRGHLNVEVSWTDVCTKPQDVTAPTVSGKLTWNQETVLTLPPETARFVVRATLADGSVRVVSGAGQFDWFVAEYNEANKVLVIRPHKIEEALR